MKKVTQDASPAEELVSPAQTPAESPAVCDKQERVEHEPAVQQPAQPDEPLDKKLCRDFLKGQCLRPLCRFSHNVHLHLDQLPRLFESCWAFQNTNKCTDSRCKFMHVSIFEQRKFYRTGELPDHAFAHQRQQWRLDRYFSSQPPPMDPPPHNAAAPNGPVHHNHNAPQQNGTDNLRKSVPVEVATMIQCCLSASSLAAFGAGVAGSGCVAAAATDERPPASASLQRNDCSHCDTLKSQEQYLSRMVSIKTARMEAISKQLEDQAKKNMELQNVIKAVNVLTAQGGSSSLEQLKELLIAQRRREKKD